MPQIDGVISLLDSRSFGTIWFWIVLFWIWSAAGRHVMGVPSEVLARAHRMIRTGQPESDEVITLLDWLSLTLPRWQMGRTEGAVALGLCIAGLSFLAVTGFGYGLEMAQALTLLLVPASALFWMRVALAIRLMPALEAAQSGRRPIAEVGHEVAGRMVTHKRLTTVLSIVSVAATAMWGMLWTLMHPFGF